MKIHVFYTCPLNTSKLKPGEFIITLSDIKNTLSSLFLVQENKSSEPTFYGRPHAPLLVLIGNIDRENLDQEMLDELVAARSRLHINHIGPLELSGKDSSKFLRVYTDELQNKRSHKEVSSSMPLTPYNLCLFNIEHADTASLPDYEAKFMTMNLK